MNRMIGAYAGLRFRQGGEGRWGVIDRWWEAWLTGRATRDKRIYSTGCAGTPTAHAR